MQAGKHYNGLTSSMTSKSPLLPFPPGQTHQATPGSGATKAVGNTFPAESVGLLAASSVVLPVHSPVMGVNPNGPSPYQRQDLPSVQVATTTHRNKPGFGETIRASETGNEPSPRTESPATMPVKGAQEEATADEASTKAASIEQLTVPDTDQSESTSSSVLPVEGQNGENPRFDQETLRSYNIELTPDQFFKMNEDPAAEEWVHCSIITDYGTMSAKRHANPSMGCRYKGSVGSLRMCVTNDGKMEPGCRKLSIKVAANAFNKTQSDTIDGMKRLIFNGAAVDYSLMSERVSYTALNELGIISPKAVHARLHINGHFAGLYVFVEAIDDVFIKDRFADDYNNGDGGLYKEHWFNAEGFKTLKKRHKQGKDEDDFFREIHLALEYATEEQALDFFEKYFDIESLVTVTAFNTLAGMTDDWRARHNFYWYVREDHRGKTRHAALGL